MKNHASVPDPKHSSQTPFRRSCLGARENTRHLEHVLEASDALRDLWGTLGVAS